MTAIEAHLRPATSSHPFGTLPLKPLLRGWAVPLALYHPGQAWVTDSSLAPVPGCTSPTEIKSIV